MAGGGAEGLAAGSGGFEGGLDRDFTGDFEAAGPGATGGTEEPKRAGRVMRAAARGGSNVRGVRYHRQPTGVNERQFQPSESHDFSHRGARGRAHAAGHRDGVERHVQHERVRARRSPRERPGADRGPPAGPSASSASARNEAARRCAGGRRVGAPRPRQDQVQRRWPRCRQDAPPRRAGAPPRPSRALRRPPRPPRPVLLEGAGREAPDGGLAQQRRGGREGLCAQGRQGALEPPFGEVDGRLQGAQPPALDAHAFSPEDRDLLALVPHRSPEARDPPLDGPPFDAPRPAPRRPPPRATARRPAAPAPAWQARDPRWRPGRRVAGPRRRGAGQRPRGDPSGAAAARTPARAGLARSACGRTSTSHTSPAAGTRSTRGSRSSGEGSAGVTGGARGRRRTPPRAHPAARRGPAGARSSRRDADPREATALRPDANEVHAAGQEPRLRIGDPLPVDLDAPLLDEPPGRARRSPRGWLA